MSRKVATLVYSRRVGSMARKAILAYCADRANDDGRAVYCSKVRIAEEVECSKQTVIDTIRDFVAEGLMVEVGREKCGNGYTVRYDICVDAVSALPEAEGVQNRTPRGQEVDRSKIGRVKPVDPRGQATGPHGVKPVDPNRPLTVLEPSKEKNPLTSPAAEFDRIWPHYPRRVGVGDARKAWLKARRAASFDEIAGPLREFIRVVRGTDPEHIPHFATWLNGERWKDEQSHARNGPRSSTDDLRGLATISATDDLNRLWAIPKAIGQ